MNPYIEVLPWNEFDPTTVGFELEIYVAEGWMELQVRREGDEHGTGRIGFERSFSLRPVEDFAERFGLSPRSAVKLHNVVIAAVTDAEHRWAASMSAAVPSPAAPDGTRPLSRPVERLITIAAERLSPALRAKYAADFETDALWIDGRLARWRYAVLLRLWTVPRLRRAEAAAAERDVPRRA